MGQFTSLDQFSPLPLLPQPLLPRPLLLIDALMRFRRLVQEVILSDQFVFQFLTSYL